MADEKVQISYDLQDNASGGLGKIGSALSSILSPTALFTAGVAALGFGIGEMVSAAENSRQVMAQTEAVLKSTGGAAGVSADAIVEHAKALSMMTNYDDEAIQSGENMLLTFTKIGKDVFPQATETMLDMSAALGQDLKSSSIQLGKALNDPISGLTALQRVGVKFTEDQKNQIQVLVESGHTMEAQKVILAELNKEFGGSAAAVASPFVIMKTALENVSEALGSKLIPFLRVGAMGVVSLASSFADFIEKIDVRGAVTNVQIWWAKLSGDTEKTVIVLKALITRPFSWETYKAVFETLIDKISLGWDVIKTILTGGFSAAKGLITKLFQDAANEHLTTTQQMAEVDKKTQQKIVKIKQDAEKEKQKANAQTVADHKVGVQEAQSTESQSIDILLAKHKQKVEEMKANNTYSYQVEVDMLNNLLATHTITAQKRAEIEAEKNGLIAKSNEETSTKIIKNNELQMQREKALRDVSVQEEIDNMNALLANDKVTKKDKEALALKLYDLETQLMKQKKQNAEYLWSDEQKEMQNREKMASDGISTQMQLTKVFLDSARQAGDQKLSIEKQILNGTLGYVKKEIIAKVDAMAAAWAIEAGARIAGSWGFDIGAWGLLAAAATASAGIRSALNSIQLAEGGIVMPRPGGTQATIGEAGQAEAVIPLGSNKAREMLGGGSMPEKLILDIGGVNVLAKVIYQKQTEMIRTGQISERRS